MLWPDPRGGMAMDRLSGKVALVTGAAVGIGAACARRMLEAGARVALVDLNDRPGRQLAAEFGNNARYFHADVAVEAGEIGRAAYRERVCQYVWIRVGAGSLKKT